MSGAPQTVSKTADISALAELSPEALALLRPEDAPPAFIAALVEKKLYPDAIRFLAHALPRREAVWWAWVSARRAAGDAPAPKIKDSLDATEKWIAQPDEDNRRAAHAAAQAVGFGTAAGCAGLAAFFAGPSIAPPNAAAVPPGEFLTAKAVAGAVIFAAIATEPAKAPEKFQASIAQGLDVTNRIKLWERK